MPENSSEKYIEGKIYEYDLNGDIIFEGQIINGEKKNGKQYIKPNSQILLYDQETNTRQQNANNANEILIYSPDVEEQIIYEGEFKDKLFWTGEFYSLNNSDKKKLLGKIINGKGRIKKYWDYEEFEGEMEKGIPWRGHLKTFNIEGKIIFDGEIRDGQKFKGKEYNKNIIFEGEFKDGKQWNGQIKSYDLCKEFEGEIKEGKYWNGKANFSDFKGEIREGKYWNGYGIVKYGEYDKIYKYGKKYPYIKLN